MKALRIFFASAATAFTLSAQPGHGEDGPIPMASVMSLAQPISEDADPIGNAVNLTIAASRHLRAGTVLQPADLIVQGNSETAKRDFEASFVGQELKRTVYEGRKFTLADVGPKTIIERNSLVTVEFAKGPLVISTEGRALDKGGVGETIRIMNLSSKIILPGVIIGPNKVSAQ